MSSNSFLISIIIKIIHLRPINTYISYLVNSDKLWTVNDFLLSPQSIFDIRLDENHARWLQSEKVKWFFWKYEIIFEDFFCSKFEDNLWRLRWYIFSELFPNDGFYYEMLNTMITKFFSGSTFISLSKKNIYIFWSLRLYSWMKCILLIQSVWYWIGISIPDLSRDKENKWIDTIQAYTIFLTEFSWVFSTSAQITWWLSYRSCHNDQFRWPNNATSSNSSLAKLTRGLKFTGAWWNIMGTVQCFASKSIDESETSKAWELTSKQFRTPDEFPMKDFPT
jgi:hypothetical protein